MTTEAGLLLELFRKSAPELFEAGGEPAMAMLCSNTNFAAVIVDRGEPRLLFQTSLVDLLRDIVLCQPVPAAAAAAAAAVPEGPLEFELGGGYSVPKAEPTFRREPEFNPAEVEMHVYHTALLDVFKQAVQLYTEQTGGEAATPQRIFLAGDAVTRHNLLPKFRLLFPSMVIEELMAARSVRMRGSDPGAREHAKEFAARQLSLAGALGLVAAASSESMLEFELTFPQAADDQDALRRADRGRGATAQKAKQGATLPKGAGAAMLAALLVAGVGTGSRYAYYASVQADLEARTATERTRNKGLEAVKAEKAAIEAKMKHTREILSGVKSMRARQVLPPQLLSIVEQSLPEGTRLEEISLSAGNVVISGNSDYRENIPKFAVALESRKEDFREVVPTTNQAEVKEWDEAAQAEIPKTIYTFSITAKYVRNVATDAEQKLVGAQGAPVTATGVARPTPQPASPAPQPQPQPAPQPAPQPQPAPAAAAMPTMPAVGTPRGAGV